MARRILDTNQLINAWHRFRDGRPSQNCTAADARAWGQRYATEGDIVRPVLIEFLCKVKTPHELRLYETFLEQFKLADGGRVIQQDWDVAEEIAKSIMKERPPRHRGSKVKAFKQRDLSDCLIEAICRRLRRECKTDDRGYPKS
ncbi:MAG TPA: hypothetical protein VHV55_27740 [Pirellulales bacterium]|jgi:hypothetical protein|nr:hypothetical protein [Pirellulales bacterium]